MIGETRFLGLYTSAAYNANPARHPAAAPQGARRCSSAPASCRAATPRRRWSRSSSSYPRDELFQIADDELYATAMGILRLGERQRTRLFVRRDVFGRFMSCLIYVPRENYNTELRVRMQALLMEAFNGIATEFSVQFSDSLLARVHRRAHVAGQHRRSTTCASSSSGSCGIARRWEDELKQALLASRRRGARQRALSQRYRRRVSGRLPRRPCAARARCTTSSRWRQLESPARSAMSLYAPLEAPPGRLRFKLFRPGTPVPAVREPADARAHGRAGARRSAPTGSTQEGAPVWIDDFGMNVRGRDEIDGGSGARAVPGNLPAHLARRERERRLQPPRAAGAARRARGHGAARLRASYLKQAGFNFSQAYIEQALAAHPAIARLLVALFKRRFDPAPVADRGVRCAEVAAQIEQALDSVSNLDEDRILRQYLALIQATLRTNFFQRAADGAPKPYLSIKFDPSKVPGLPEPRPKFEIFVYSPRIEGVHLRGGKVARGGIRWSDRMEDFRTEVLGLMKAQKVKNAVIVPVGSKGGFVRQAPAGGRRPRGAAEGRHRLLPGAAARPARPDRQPGRRQGGASAARRAPRPRRPVPRRRRGQGHRDVLRHRQRRVAGIRLLARRRLRLRRLGRLRPQEDGHHRARRVGVGEAALPRRWASTRRRTDFTVAGIGDMSGDVFGNGMLLSQHIRLVAAFDHRHVFIDPAPDAAGELSRAPAAVPAAALVVGRLRREADLERRRHLPAQREIDAALARDSRGARHRRPTALRRTS